MKTILLLLAALSTPTEFHKTEVVCREIRATWQRDQLIGITYRLTDYVTVYDTDDELRAALKKDCPNF